MLYHRLVSRAFAFTCVVLIISSCGFFGSRYSSESNSNSVVAQGGPATQLTIRGFASMALGTCAGPFFIEPKDVSGNPSEPMSSSTVFQVTETSGARVYLDSDCDNASRAVNGLVPLTNPASNSAEFYLSGVRAGDAMLSATYAGLMPAAMPVNYVPGAPAGIRWNGSRSIATFSCVETNIEVVDATGTVTSAPTPGVIGTSVAGLGRVNLYSAPNCRTPITSITMPANVSSVRVWVFASEAGDFSLTGTPAPTNWTGTQTPMTALNSSAPKLVFSAATTSVVSNECAVFNLDSFTQTGDLLVARNDTPVTITGADPAVTVYSTENCSGTPTRALTLLSDNSRVKFSAKAAIASGYDLTGSAAMYVSGTTRLNVRGGTPTTLSFTQAPSSARANECRGPYEVQLKDAAGNDTTTVNGLTVGLTHNAPAGKTKFFTNATCTNPDVTSVSIAAQTGNITFYQKSEIPGSVDLTANAGGFSPLTQRVAILNSVGYPNYFGLQLISAAPLRAGNCLIFRLQSLDANRFPMEVAVGGLQAHIGSNSATSRIFSGNNCQTENSDIGIAAGATEAIFSLIDTDDHSITLTALDNNPLSTTVGANLQFATEANLPAQLVFEGLTNPINRTQCYSAVVVLKDAYGNEAQASANTLVRFDSSVNLTFFAACYGATVTSVTVPANSSRIAFGYSAPAGSQSRAVAVGPVGIAADSRLLDVSPPPPTHLAITAASSPVIAGECVRFSVSSLDPSNQPLLLDNLTISLMSSGLTGIFFSDSSCQVPASAISMGPSVNPGNFYIKSNVTSNGPFIITATASDGKTATYSVTIAPGVASALSLAGQGPSSPVRGSWVGPYSISLVDTLGNLAPAQADLDLQLNAVALGAQLSSRNDGTVVAPRILAGGNTTTFYLFFSDAGNFSLALKSGALVSNSRAISIKNPSGAITSVTPNTGLIGGGNTASIAGGPFITGATVTFGGTDCPVVSIAPALITCTVPGHAVGPVDVVVTNPLSDPRVSVAGYTYTGNPPTFGSITPQVGLASGGTSVTIYGSGFLSGVVVTLGGSVCNVGSRTATSIVCETTQHAAGLVPLSIRNPDLGEVTVPGAFTYNPDPPTLSSITPVSGPVTGGTVITLTGTRFVSGTSIGVGGVPCLNTTYVSPTTMRCETPSRDIAGAVPVTAVNPGSATAVLPSAFLYTGPATLLVAASGPSSPIRGTWAGPYTVTVLDTYGNPTPAVTNLDIVLQNLAFGSQISSRNDGTVAVPRITSGSNSTTFYLYFSDVGSYNLAVRSGSLSSPVRVLTVRNPTPSCNSVSPNTGPVAGGNSITLSGGTFYSGVTVTVGGLACPVTQFSATSIACTAPAHAAGVVDVIITNPSADPRVISGGYTYVGPNPVFTSLSPTSGSGSGGTSVTINGSGFLTNPSVTFGGSICNVTSFSATRIICTTTEHSAGAVALRIVNSDLGSVNVSNAFTYTVAAPTISTVSPSTSTLAGGIRITLTGTEFNSSSTITVGGAACTATTLASPTSISCLVPARTTAGAVNVVLTNPGFTPATKTNGFTYTGPAAITSVSPLTGVDSASTTITLNGTNFDAGMSVKIGNAVCGSLAIASTTRATCIAPPQTEGAYPIQLLYNGTVINASVATFTYVPPPGPGLITVTSISPTSGPTGGGTSLTINGTNFSAGMHIYLGNTECVSLQIVSVTRATCVTAPRTPGNASLSFRRGTEYKLVSNIVFTYTGAVASYPCSVFSQVSQSCGDTHLREFGAAWAPLPPGLTLSNGMLTTTITPYLTNPKHIPSGTFSTKCSGRAPSQINTTPFPSTITGAGNVVYQLFTNGNLGSASCPAFYSQYYSPLIIDMNDQGIALSAPNAGVRFDINGTGEKIAISWPTNPLNSLFVVLPNDDGKVESINELFGNNTVGPDGKKADNGFEALAKYDRNGDKIIDASDSVFTRLRLWSDKNFNGRVDSGELSTLSSKKVKLIDLKYENISERNDFYGNETKQRSVIELTNQQLRRILDIWFVPG